jgi:type III secretion system (T3SS) inner membrane Yop/YscD-like protein
MLIALSLSIAEPLIDHNYHGVAVNGAVGAMLGLFGGVIVSLFVDRLHHALGGSDAADLNTVRQSIANAIKYGVIGSFLLIAPGLLMRNVRKLGVGLAGGFVGGVIGGLLFAPVAKLSGSPMLARALATITIGLLAGAATGMIENVAKSGWLKVIQGFIAGKQFILYRATTYIGSSPDCHVYLFKDPAIGRRHAAVHVVPGGFDLEDLPLGGATFVNGKAVSRVRLRSGDQIQVGQTAFTFQEKVKAA